ncbi:histidine phosphatase family protein [uncultured Tateyamaria sp.]|uniref:histidine phosphatase family protein n=1 Tax=uncultured Tateyamaria sp. TaxID=455651 RepID=UPI0026380BF2|nr:histidine phosphatase family protein [uncultured Tateyamaria sp.]
MTHPDLLILRHGETEWNRAGRMQGTRDSPLTAQGRAQAGAQANILARFGIEGWMLYASPQGRAVSTARIAYGARAAEIITDPRLSEITMGAWTGCLRTEIAAQMPHLFEGGSDLGWYDHAPGGEGLEALYARTGAFLAQCTGPSVIVTHGITSRMLRCHALGLDAGAFADLPGGQGVVYHLSGGVQNKLADT